LQDSSLGFGGSLETHNANLVNIQMVVANIEISCCHEMLQQGVVAGGPGGHAVHAKPAKLVAVAASTMLPPVHLG